MPPRAQRRAAVAFAIGGLALAWGAPARADDDVQTTLLVIGLVGLAAADVGLGIYDVDVAAQGKHPAPQWQQLEASVATPQALAGTALLIAVVGFEKKQDEMVFPALVPTMVVDSLTVHGFWPSAGDRPAPAEEVFGSLAVGVDAALSTVAITRAFTGHLSRRWIGVTEALLAAPQVVFSGHEAVRASGVDQGAWTALGVWSGALFAHGIVSVILGVAGMSRLHTRRRQVSRWRRPWSRARPLGGRALRSPGRSDETRSAARAQFAGGGAICARSRPPGYM